MASEYEFTTANLIKPGYFLLMKKHPCKVLEVHRSSTGKHGGAKLRFVGLDLITKKKVEDMFMSSDHVEVPVVKKNDYPILGMDEDGYVSLLMKNGETRKDISVTDDDVREKIASKLQDGMSLMAIIVSTMGRDAFDNFKVSH